MAALSLISLVLVALLCAVGALSRHYPDNLLQRLGLASVGLSCVALAEHVWRLAWVTPACALLSIGMLAFGLGTAAKVLKFRALDLLSDDDEVHP